MSAATYQPELCISVRGEDYLTGMKGRVFAPECLLDHKYYLEDHPDYYFIVRQELYNKSHELERVVLYQDKVINQHLRPDMMPFTNLISNEARNGRHIETIYRDMNDKVSELNFRPKTK